LLSRLGTLDFYSVRRSVLLFLLAVTFLSIAFFEGGSLIMLLLFVVGFGGSISLFLKAKPTELMF
jgi:hypothetical protein